jgi:hypothetical protein
MIQEAQACGLAFDPSVVAQLKPNPLGTVHNAVVDIYKYLPTQPRAIPYLNPAMVNIEFHPSTITRLGTRAVAQGDYRPSQKLHQAGDHATFRVFAHNEWHYTGLFLEKGVDYEFAAEGEWMDGTVKFGPDGKANNFGFRLVLHWVVTPIGWCQRLIRKAQHNAQINLPSVRRVADRPWFALIGTIVNGVYGQPKGFRADEVFMIGNRIRLKPKADGYFYPFANDAWNHYGNNQGSVNVTVTRMI